MSNTIENKNNNYELINRFINTVLKNKTYLRHSEIELSLNMTIKSLLNYDCILSEEDNQYINLHFSDNYKYTKEINEAKLKALKDFKKLVPKPVGNTGTTSADKEESSILSFQFPQFELYFVAKLYVNGMPIEPEYTTELVFSSQLSQTISMRYKYRDLTPESFITISVYSMQLPQEKNLLGSTTISIFDENFNLVQGRHIFNLHPKHPADCKQNSLTNGRSNDPIDKEIDLLIFTYHQKDNNNISIKKDALQSLEGDNMTNEDIINSYIYDPIKKELELKNDYLRNYESKLDFLLTKTKNCFIEIDFPSFNNPVIYDEKISLSYKKCFKCLKLKNRPNTYTNWICDPILKKGRTENKDFLSKDNPMTEKFSLLSRMSDDAFARDIRPSPVDSATINELLNKPDFIDLDHKDSGLFWTYRYDLLKCNKKYALTKILNSTKWGEPKAENECIKNILLNWTNVEISDTLYMLSARFNVNDAYPHYKAEITDGKREVRKYAADQLKTIDDEELNFILLQLVQALRYENQENSPLRKVLIERCRKTITLASSFYWFLNVETDDREKDKAAKEDRVDITEMFKDIKDDFIDSFDKDSSIYKDLRDQITLNQKLIEISVKLQSEKKGERKLAKLRELLNDNEFESLSKDSFSLPLEPKVKICKVKQEKCNVFKSAKYPVKYRFDVTPETKQFNNKNENPDIFETMFKYGDDLRQDQLVLQIISYMDMLLKKVHLDYEFTTYKVLATSKTDGFVEFVANSTTIYDILNAKSQQIKPFLEENARKNNEETSNQLSSFINSCAGYCVVTYILGIGDRHLENLLIDNKGRLFHIDFGFILGKDPKPYPPPMKLCKQMVECMGGNESKQYEDFKTKCVNAYWVLRDNARLIVNMFYLMIDAGIPELNNTDILQKLFSKFSPEMSRQDASNSLLNKLEESVNAFSQVVVDKIHAWAQYWK